MPELEIVTITTGRFVQNCLLVIDAASGATAIVDPGEDGNAIVGELDVRGLEPTAIWLTHAHIDHVLGIPAVRQRFPVPIYLHPADQQLYDGVPAQAEWFGLRADRLPAPDRELAHGTSLHLGATAFAVRHVPGHSPGSVAFITPGYALSGDALFAGSIGRTDLPGGDTAQLLESIRQELLTLPDSTVVKSGHGPDTTIGVERLTNPFLRADARVE